MKRFAWFFCAGCLMAGCSLDSAPGYKSCGGGEIRGIIDNDVHHPKKISEMTKLDEEEIEGLGEGYCTHTYSVCVEGEEGAYYCSVCEKNKLKCEESCIDVMVNKSHCGSCGNACGDAKICEGGVCNPCPGEDLRSCGGNACTINIKTDVQNCGTCGNACGPNEYCDNGHCAIEGKFRCEGLGEIDPESDAYCGATSCSALGQKCKDVNPDFACVNKICQCPEEGQEVKENACVWKPATLVFTQVQLSGMETILEITNVGTGKNTSDCHIQLLDVNPDPVGNEPKFTLGKIVTDLPDTLDVGKSIVFCEQTTENGPANPVQACQPLLHESEGEPVSWELYNKNIALVCGSNHKESGSIDAPQEYISNQHSPYIAMIRRPENILPYRDKPIQVMVPKKEDPNAMEVDKNALSDWLIYPNEQGANNVFMEYLGKSPKNIQAPILTQLAFAVDESDSEHKKTYIAAEIANIGLVSPAGCKFKAGVDEFATIPDFGLLTTKTICSSDLRNATCPEESTCWYPLTCDMYFDLPDLFVADALNMFSIQCANGGEVDWCENYYVNDRPIRRNCGYYIPGIGNEADMWDNDSASEDFSSWTTAFGKYDCAPDDVTSTGN